MAFTIECNSLSQFATVQRAGFAVESWLHPKHTQRTQKWEMPLLNVWVFKFCSTFKAPFGYKETLVFCRCTEMM